MYKKNKDSFHKKIRWGNIDTVKRVLKNVLNVRPPSDIKQYYLDINSIFSIIYYYSNELNDEKNINELTLILEEFINKTLLNGIKITFIYTIRASKIHRDIYPNWCEERYKRVELTQNNFIKNFIVGLTNISKDRDDITIINVKDLHPLLYIDYCESIYNRKFLILSKDNIMSIYRNSKATIFTGCRYIDRGDPYSENIFRINKLKSYSDLLNYILIAGDKRNEFKGVEGYGKIKTLNYISDYEIQIKSDLDHPLKDHIDKYKCLYDITEMRKYYEANKDSFIFKF